MFVYFSLNTLNNCEINNLRRIFFIHLVSNNLEPIIYKVHKNYKPKKFGMEQDREEEEREKKWALTCFHSGRFCYLLGRDNHLPSLSILSFLFFRK